MASVSYSRPGTSMSTSTRTSPTRTSLRANINTLSTTRISPRTSPRHAAAAASAGVDSDDEEDIKPPELSALAQTLFEIEAKDGSMLQSGKGSSPISGNRSRTGITVGDSVLRDRSFSRRGASPALGEMVTPAPVRYSRKPYTSLHSSTQDGSSGGSSGGSADGKTSRANPIHETPAASNGIYTGSVLRPSGSYLRPRPNTTTRRAIRLGNPIRGPRRDADNEYDMSSPDEVLDNPLNDVKMGSPVAHREQEATLVEDPMDVDGNATQKSPSPLPYSRRTSPRIDAYVVQETSPQSASHLSPRRIRPLLRKASPFEAAQLEKAQSPPFSRGEQSSESRPVLKYNVPPPPPSNDKENMPPPPPTFKRPVSSSIGILQTSFPSKTPAPSQYSPVRKSAVATPEVHNTPRDILSNRSVNTPMRSAPPPPPPKMSILATATAQAGSATTATRKKRQHVVVNGRQYLRLDQIGRGGSAKVYKVMAENFKMLAMKKVSLDKQDEASIRGFKQEIDLLKRLENEDRVVHIYDYEVNDEKGTLTVLLECGELDLNRLMTSRHNSDDAVLDLSFVRHYWKEMLECVEAVHRKNIVHSDLKPANFVLVQGRLKLIDFGIANAIQDDTVNVHREQQVGTISYMAPEAIVDFNAGKKPSNLHNNSSGDGNIPSAPRLHKLGAPSDVWSLGCILYQMTYGRTPFAHLSNMYSKMQAIPNPSHIIDYPNLGIGGTPVPYSLIETMKGCLDRDVTRRVTIRELLSTEDLFLNPERAREGVVDVAEDTLVSLLENACEYTRDKGPPTEDHVRLWAKDVFGKLRRKMFERRRGGGVR